MVILLRIVSVMPVIVTSYFVFNFLRYTLQIVALRLLCYLMIILKMISEIIRLVLISRSCGD